MSNTDNIVLIGMPGAGKSTIGVLLAKATSRSFMDTDVVLQAEEGRRLAEIIESEGREKFQSLEENTVLAINAENHVIATGGSVVYSDAAMQHLRSIGRVVYLDVPLTVLEQRLSCLADRGVVFAPGQELADLFREREPLYRRYAHVTIECAARSQEEIVNAIITSV